MKQLGYGMLRLPLTNPKDDASIDMEKTKKLIDLYISKGGNYFDTAYTYHGQKSEEVLKKAVMERYPREEIIVTDKLPTWQVPSREACEEYFQVQLERCGAEYFDYFFLHWLNRSHYQHAKDRDFFGFLEEKKREGKIRHIGFSYHDDAAVLEEILRENPSVEVVQLQLNYLDWESPEIQAKACYDTAVKYGKKVYVMEPVKGGTLANVPEEVEALMRKRHPDWSPAAWAVRFALSQPEVEVVLSGMNEEEQILDNMKTAENYQLGTEELELLKMAADMITKNTTVPCTACRYCVKSCPKNICIPDYFALYNSAKRFPEDGWKLEPLYHGLGDTYGKASDCITCRQCEKHCPQKIKITEHLMKIADMWG